MFVSTRTACGTLRGEGPSTSSLSEISQDYPNASGVRQSSYQHREIFDRLCSREVVGNAPGGRDSPAWLLPFPGDPVHWASRRQHCSRSVLPFVGPGRHIPHHSSHRVVVPGRGRQTLETCTADDKR